MPSVSRHRAGRVAQKIGQTFEAMLYNLSVSQGICCVRIPDGCRQIRGPRGYQLLRVSTPFDYVLFYKDKSIVLDTKTTEGSTFTYSAIQSHQLTSLTKCAKHIHAAGYLVWHRDTDDVVFYSHRHLLRLRPRESLSAVDGFNLGPYNKMDLTRLFANPIPRPIDSEQPSTDP